MSLVEEPALRATRELRGWIDSRLGDFLAMPDPFDNTTLVSRLTPITELALVLHALAAPRHRRAGSSLVDWSRQTAGRLAKHAERVGRSLDWDRLADNCRSAPSVFRALLMFPLLASVTGHQWSFAARLNAVGQEAASPRYSQCLEQHLDYHLLLEWLDVVSCVSPCVAHLERVIRCLEQGKASTSKLYDLTHAVFYATSFGHRQLRLPDPADSWLRQRLPGLIQERCDQGDLDLAAELLVTQSYLGAFLGASTARTTDQLTEAVLSSDELPTADYLRGLPTFHRLYHVTLTCLLATAEALAR